MLAIFTGIFSSGLCLCAKAYVFIRGRGEPRVLIVGRARVSVTRHACICACLECFCGLNPRTIPQLSLNKFRAPLGYRGLVLGLNVPYFFRSLGTLNETRAEQTQPSGSRDIITSHKNCTDPSWKRVSVPAVFCLFFVLLLLLFDFCFVFFFPSMPTIT